MMRLRYNYDISLVYHMIILLFVILQYAQTDTEVCMHCYEDVGISELRNHIEGCLSR